MGNEKAWIRWGQKLQSVDTVSSTTVGLGGVEASGCREVCSFHLPAFPAPRRPPPHQSGVGSVQNSSVPFFISWFCLPIGNTTGVVTFFLSFLWFPRFLGPLQWLKAECMQCRGSVQNSSLHPFLHSKNSSGQCKNFRNPTPSSGAVQQQRWGQTTDLPLNGRHVSRTGWLLNYWCSCIFPLKGNKV